MAIVCVAYASISLINYAVFITVQGWPRYFPGWSASAGQKLELGSTMCAIGSQLTLLVGALGLLNWKRWSRILILVAAWSMIGFTFLSTVGWFIMYTTQMNAARATTRFVGPPTWFYGWTMLIHCLTTSVFPVIVLWVMFQREVVNLWSRDAARAFEVLPVAKAIEGMTP